MYFRRIIRIIGLLIILFSTIIIIPILIEFIYRDGEFYSFIKTFIYTIAIGLFLWLPNLNQNFKLKSCDSFIIVVMFWFVIGSIGSLPFLFNKYLKLSITDAFFESFSGLTTTGATVLTGLDKLPHAILFYRQILQWIGGMGIIVLAIAVLPSFGINGIKLYQAEISGPFKDNKIQPRIAKTAKTLWLIYIILTITCSLMLWLAGMSLFDAVSQSFSIISIGGFSTHDNNISYYNNYLINIIISIFLIISSCNYGLHFNAINTRNLKIYWYDFEYRMFIFIHLILIFICIIILWYNNVYNSIIKIINFTFFQVISVTTTSGFFIDNFFKWPLFLPILIFCSSFIGGCSGSTGGGLKTVRILIIYLQSSKELKKLIHPNAIYNIKLGNLIVSKRTLDTVWGFFSIYIIVFIVSMLLLISTGIDNFYAFTIVIATLNNLGLNFGVISENFSSVNYIAKWIMIFIMLLGRLEIFTLLVIFTPTFWKK